MVLSNETIKIKDVPIRITYTVDEESVQARYCIDEGDLDKTNRYWFKKPIKLSNRTASSKKVKEAVQYLQRSGGRVLRELLLLYLETTEKVLTGKVLWFDKRDGIGLVHDSHYDIEIEVHACNIKGAKTCFGSTACVYLNQGQDVTFTVDAYCGAQIAEGGIFDEEKWKSLKHENLPFLKDDDGNVISGLFAKGD